jgi:hypothetical protein
VVNWLTLLKPDRKNSQRQTFLDALPPQPRCSSESQSPRHHRAHPDKLRHRPKLCGTFRQQTKKDSRGGGGSEDAADIGGIRVAVNKMDSCSLFFYTADGTLFWQPLCSGCRRSSWYFRSMMGDT